MKKLISEFTSHLKQALVIAENTRLEPAKNEIKNIVISGMGGSGIGGNIVSDATVSELKIPLIVNKNYFLPHFVNENTLVIISSYSGDTEETLKAFDEAIERKAKIVCVTSGGKIGEIAANKSIDFILIPKGLPPRAALGYSLVQLLNVLYTYQIISSSFKTNILATIKLLDAEEKNITRDAKETARLFFEKLPIIYGIAGMESVAIRFRQQLNENSKLLCWHNVFPELNHNELQGWSKEDGNFIVIVFRNEIDYKRTAKRIDVSTKIINNYNADIKEIYSKGNSLLERILYLVHWGDWVSCFLAEMHGVDTMNIQVITYLKSELSKMEENVI